jgi:hypothetical protein
MRISALYSNQGFQVTVRPKPDELPAFARDFNVELMAKRGAEGVLVSVKKNRQALEDDKDLPRYAEITNKQPGWRYDFAILEEENPLARDLRGAREPSASDIGDTLNDVARALEAGYINPALVAAWGALEAAMRKRLLSDGKDTGWGTQPRSMLNELRSTGILSTDDFRSLEAAWRLRNEIVHGFRAGPVNADTVQFLINIAKRLLIESQTARQTA